MKIALVHDFLTQYGGAERFLEAVYTIFKSDDVQIFTLRFNAQAFPEVWNTYPINQLAYALPYIDYYPQLYAPYLTAVVEQLDFAEFDVVFSSDLIFAKNVICQPRTAHISYQHTPSRNLYPYAASSEKRVGMLQLATMFQKSFLRSQEYIATTRIDRLLTNSRTTAERIWAYYKRSAEVIYSFVDIPSREEFVNKYKPEGEYFLCVARLVADKRIELAVQACNALGQALVVVGDGSERAKLEKLAGPSIRFVGQVDDNKKQELFAQCKALIVPGLEDFGLTPLEAMAWGKPVLAYGDGGVTESVVNGETGEFFYNQSSEDIERVISEFDPSRYSAQKCRDQASRFSRGIFEQKIKSVVDEVTSNQ